MNSDLENNKLLVNIMEAASLLSVGRSTVYKLMNSGDLKVIKIGCAARITMASVRALVGTDAMDTSAQ